MVSLFYLNMVLALALILAIFFSGPLKTYQRPLLGIIFLQLLVQLLLTLRILGVKENFQLLHGLSYPIQILQIVFLDQFYQFFTARSDVKIKTPRLLWIGFGFSVAWYIGSHTLVEVSELQYGLAFHPYNVGRLLATSILVVFTVRRIYGSLQSFKKWGLMHFSDVAQLRLPILYGITAYLLLTYLIAVVDFMTGPDIQLFQIMPLLFFVGIFGLVVFCLKTAKVFLLEMTAPAPTNDKLSQEEMGRVQAKLTVAIQADRIYLNPDLRLTDLAKAVDERPYKVTLVLSRMMGKTFNDFINYHRIEHAKTILLDKKFEHFNIVGIALESGFNSKSVFNDLFKRVTGQTPSEFRKS
jgi:AraC-like DNA-binding protein